MVYQGIVKSKNRLAREVGTVVKDWGGRLPVALVYPNSYYIGMSNLGVHALYSLLNSYDHVVCERVFWEEGMALSLESRRPLADFPVIAFTVSYELDYFNVVRVLRAGGIPLRAADRDERHPLVIAGGPCIMANPAPLAPFFDGLCIGEAEAILPDLLPVISDSVLSRRDEQLRALAGVPGVYVSALPPEQKVVRQYVDNLDDFPVASAVLTRDTELGDLYLIEVGRGCRYGCRFCLVSQAFSPARFRSLESILVQAEAGLLHRKRIGLVGPAVTDHPRIEEMLAGLRRMEAGISISSMRLRPLSANVLEEMAAGGARTLTLAPEAGSERLRRALKKGITEDDILRAMELVAECGFKQLKLYFMIGLPGETDDDVQGIIDLVLKCKSILDKKISKMRLSLNVAPFVPKAGTPFQWLPMAAVTVLDRRLSRLKKDLAAQGIRIKPESTAWSQVQAVLARGDDGLAEVLAGMEEVSLSGWRRSVHSFSVDVDYYAHRHWGSDAELPWAMHDPGVNLGYLEREMEAAFRHVR